MARTALSAFAAWMLLASVVFAAETPAVSFTTKPTAAKAAGGVKIEFAVSAPTDVAAFIEDGNGKIVRHLAAGMLGPNAPAPLRKGSLAQSLLWDGKDDSGKPVDGSAGPLKVRVSLGLTPRLDRFIGANPAQLGSVRALAAGPTGELFVFHVYGGIHPSDNSLSCAVFSRQGKYLRTILPFPAGLPDEKLKGIKRVQAAPGVKVPFLYQLETRSFVPGGGDLPPCRPVLASDGRLAFVGVQELGCYARSGRNQVVVLRTDGSIPNKVLGTVTDAASYRGASLALSPDEKTVYASDLGRGTISRPRPYHVVHRFGWADEKSTLLVGVPNEPGADAKHLNDPHGIATDKDGNLYVADRGNNRVAVFKPDGSFRGAIKVDRPERVEVHPTSGAVYVLGGANTNELRKFQSFTADKPLAELALPFFKHPYYTAVMALDGSADPPVLWVASPHGYYARFGLLRIEDRGDRFARPVDIAKSPENTKVKATAVRDLVVDRKAERVWVNGGGRFRVRGFDGRTGQPIKTSFPLPKGAYSEGTICSAGLDGMWYVHASGTGPKRTGQGVYRLDRRFQPAPFPGSDSSFIPNVGSLRLHGRGVTADAAGNVYVLWQPKYAKEEVCLAVYGPDGKPKNERLIEASIRSLNSVRVDYSGNIYLAVGVRPGKELLPPGLAGKLPQGKKDPDAVRGINYYPLICGSIIKFGPGGGAIGPGVGGSNCNHKFGEAIQVRGARWIAPGAGVPAWTKYRTVDVPVCLCESPNIDVDGFGRTFFPDMARFRVGVLDTAGNVICWFGSYGNPDADGTAGPAIPLQWPYAVGVSDEAVYVGDRLNRRVVRVKLGYAAEETVELK